MKAGKLQHFPALFLFPTKPQSKNDNILESNAIQIFWSCRCAIWPFFPLKSFQIQSVKDQSYTAGVTLKTYSQRPGRAVDFSRPQHHNCPVPVRKISSLNGRKVPFLSGTGRNSHALIHGCSSPARPGLPELGSHQFENWDPPKAPCSLQLKADHWHGGSCGFCKWVWLQFTGQWTALGNESGPRQPEFGYSVMQGTDYPFTGIQTLPVLGPPQNRRLLSYSHALHQLWNSAAETHDSEP